MREIVGLSSAKIMSAGIGSNSGRFWFQPVLVVQALSTDGADQSLAESDRLRAVRRRFQHRQPYRLNGEIQGPE